MRTSWVAATVVGLALVGCEANDVAGADPFEPNLNEAFTLVGAQQSSIKGTDLDLRFSGVQEDSRCPKAVACFWTGQARLTIEAQTEGQQPITLSFNTNPAPGQNAQLARAGEYTVALQSLDPYPETPDESTTLQDYRATLVVRKA